MIVIVGAGVAGLSCAIAAVQAGAEVTLVTPDMRGGNTAMAQGGIAAAIAPGDSAADHLADTLRAGGGLVDEEAARVLVTDGAAIVQSLIEAGFAVDTNADGTPSFGLEAAHGRPRIVHAGGDRTGARLHAFLFEQVQALAAAGEITLREGHGLVSLTRAGASVIGVDLRDREGALTHLAAEATVLATGGYAASYSRTSNQAGATGSGIVLAARAGAVIADLEFVQFHPTVLAGTGELISEAVRGAGAVLRDDSGRRFMVDRHEDAELAPRDVVSREIHRHMRETGSDTVWLDATGIERERGAGALAQKFPGITQTLASHDIDWTKQLVPVAPAAHYTMGGVISDLEGRSSVPGLFVAGEVSSTGVHGANRLASNSLLEGLVFGQRAGKAAAAHSALVQALAVDNSHGRPWRFNGAGARAACDLAKVELLPQPAPVGRSPEPSEKNDQRVAAILDASLGIERNAQDLAEAAAELKLVSGMRAELATMICVAALARSESRGAHQRADAPRPDTAQATRNAFVFTRVQAVGEPTDDPAKLAASARPGQHPSFSMDTSPIVPAPIHA